MKLKHLLSVSLIVIATTAVCEELQRLPSAEGAEVGFANLEGGDVVRPKFTVKFTIAGMGIAPAGAQIDYTGHHHLLIDIDELREKMK